MPEIKHDPIYDNFLQYVSMCGPLNLRLVAADKWHLLKDLIQGEQGFGAKQRDVDFLNELFIPYNKELGKFVSSLYKKPESGFNSNPALGLMNIEDQQSPRGAEVAFKTTFPSYHSVKLCVLGKAYSGKKT